MKQTKRISKGGGITLPASLRRDYGIAPGERVEIAPQPNGDILIRRTEGACMFTGEERDLINYKGRLISAGAVSDMLAEFDDELRNQILRGAGDPT